MILNFLKKWRDVLLLIVVAGFFIFMSFDQANTVTAKKNGLSNAPLNRITRTFYTIGNVHGVRFGYLILASGCLGLSALIVKLKKQQR